MSTRRLGRSFWLATVAVALVCAGVVSGFASAAPDGLESVAERLGFAERAHEGASFGLAGYEVPGLDGRLSGGLAGVIGTLVVLALVTAITWRLRRRGSAEAG